MEWIYSVYMKKHHTYQKTGLSVKKTSSDFIFMGKSIKFFFTDRIYVFFPENLESSPKHFQQLCSIFSNLPIERRLSKDIL